MDRRNFLKKTAAAGLAAAAGPSCSEAGETSVLPRRPLGKTGVEVTRLAFGGGGHFLGRIEGDEAEARRLIERAFELGIRYFDTAAGYTFRPHERLSETYYGRVLAPHRDQIFLATKCGERDRDGMLRSVEKSLELLRTDHLDLVQMHSLREREELDQLERPDGGLTALRELKEQKVVRFIGATGHYDPDVLLAAVERFDIDTLLMSLNAAQTSHPLSMTPDEPLTGFEEKVLPAAVAKGIGVNAMKVMGQGRIVGDSAASARELIHYVLSLPVATAVIGHTSLAILEENVAAARSFRPMDEGEKAALRSRVSGSASAWARFLRSHHDDVA